MDPASAAHGVVKGLVREVSGWVSRVTNRPTRHTHSRFILSHTYTTTTTTTTTPQTIDLFGPGRCMFASNFPVDKLLASLDSLEALVAAQHALVADMEEEDRRALFHDTAARVYKFVASPVQEADEGVGLAEQAKEGVGTAVAVVPEPGAEESTV